MIVNELSDRTMEADLVDLNSPEHGHLMNNNQVNINRFFTIFSSKVKI